MWNIMLKVDNLAYIFRYDGSVIWICIYIYVKYHVNSR